MPSTKRINSQVKPNLAFFVCKIQKKMYNNGGRGNIHEFRKVRSWADL